MNVAVDKTALLIVAHGSRRSASNDEVRQLTDRIRDLNTCPFALVESAFLELAEPSIPEGIAHCIAQGAERVLVLPYFLSRGRHVAEDIPAEVEQARRANPQVEVKLCNYLGEHDGVPGLMLTLALER